MTAATFWSYVGLTLTQPRAMARVLLRANLSREALWLAFALVIVLNTLVFSASIIGTASVDIMGPILSSPITFALMLAMSVGLVVLAVTWSGRALGGKARMEDIALMVIWLQGLRVFVQVAVTAMTPFSPFFAGLVVMAASLFGLWIFVNFIDEAHGLNNMFKSIVTLVLAIIGMTLGLSMILSLLGFSAAGLSGHV